MDYVAGRYYLIFMMVILNGLKITKQLEVQNLDIYYGPIVQMGGNIKIHCIRRQD